MSLNRCRKFGDFRALARRRLPGPIFHCIGGAADDETTCRRNTETYDDCDLVPNVLVEVSDIDLSVTVTGQKLAMPVFCAPTALRRLFHRDGERAVAAAAHRFGTMFGVSSLGTVSVKELAEAAPGPRMFQFYFHKDRGLNQALLERTKAANFGVLAHTVDKITGGNRERDLHTGFPSPPPFALQSLLGFALHPRWTLDFLTGPKFDLPHLSGHVSAGTDLATSVEDYFSTMLDQSMTRADAESLCAKWGGQLALKGVMSVADAWRAVDIGCTGIVVSNHGGRQLDGSRSPFDQISEIVEAV